jgi:hypothetical protein
MAFIPGKPIDFAAHYEAIAEAWANHLDQPFEPDGMGYLLSLDLLQALWNVYPELIEMIETDPLSFSDRVSMYRLVMHQN